jgi:MFS family permease
LKFGIALTFILIYCFTTELYPTQIRGLAFGLANTFGRLATIISALMVAVPASLFMWLNVGLSILIILCTFLLPETKGIELTDKISENKVEDSNGQKGTILNGTEVENSKKINTADYVFQS